MNNFLFKLKIKAKSPFLEVDQKPTIQGVEIFKHYLALMKAVRIELKGMKS